MSTKEQAGKNIQEVVLPHELAELNNMIYEEENVHVKDFVIGAFVGGIIGAAVGLLLAPKPGKDLRGDVAEQAVSLKDKSVELSSTAKEKTVQLSSQLKEQSTQLVDKVKGKSVMAPTVFDDGTVSSEGEEPLEDVVEKVSNAIEGATDGMKAVAEKAKDKLKGEEEEDKSEVSRPSSIK